MPSPILVLVPLGWWPTKEAQEEGKLQLRADSWVLALPLLELPLTIPRLQSQRPQERGGPLTLLLAVCWTAGEIWS